MTYQLAILIITLLSLITMGIVVKQNGRLTKGVKIRFILAYLSIGLAAIAEWAADLCEGGPTSTIWLHSVFKFFDYSLTPLCAVFLVRQVSEEKLTLRHKIIYISLLVNAIVEFISIFTNWTFAVDANNHYYEGPIYIGYVIFYSCMILAVLFDFIIYSRKFAKRNLVTLFFIVAVGVISGLLTEIHFPGVKIRVAYIGLAISAMLLYIHYTEYANNKTAIDYKNQITISLTDAMTGLQNRTAFKEKLVELKNKPKDEEFIIYAIDVNGLKKTNDSLGHSIGDELINEVAKVIKDNFGKNGNCYRTGGDEFIVITENKNENPMVLVYEFKEKLMKFHSKTLNSASASIGFARRSEHPDESVEQIANIADMMMYRNKSEYYRNK